MEETVNEEKTNKEFTTSDQKADQIGSDQKADQIGSDQNAGQIVSDQESGDREAIKSVQFSPLSPAQTKQGGKSPSNIDMLMDIHIPIVVELGNTEMLVKDVLALNSGSIVELDSLAGEPVKVTVRGKVIAHGEVVVIDENFGVKITKIANTQERIKSMG